MLEEMTKVKCPVCEGEGELAPATIVEKFVNPELRARLVARIEEITDIYSSESMATRSRFGISRRKCTIGIRPYRYGVRALKN
jgi:hypothetical protein